MIAVRTSCKSPYGAKTYITMSGCSTEKCKQTLKENNAKKCLSSDRGKGVKK